MHITDLAVDAQWEAVEGVTRALARPGLSDDRRALLELAAPWLASAVPCYWSAATFEAGAGAADALRPMANEVGSSLDPATILGGAEWWLFDTPELWTRPEGLPPDDAETAILIPGAVLLIDYGPVVRAAGERLTADGRDLALVVFARLNPWQGGRANQVLQPIGAALWPSRGSLGQNRLLRPAELGGPVAPEDEPLLDYLLFVNAAMRWRQTPYAVTERTPVSRGCRRRLTRAGVTSAPLVITLREREDAPRATAEEQAARRSFMYRCLFAVRGHVRHLATGKQTWVRPHLKGPRDGPRLEHPGGTRIQVTH